ncbi:hypothetical protein DCS_01427 [Drechmeria coniospora]|uniref:COP9 signalosome complex subunit 3 N-terminal helical repeats domain-containing protein n=1 Tax=Drechmeria coniospora TaxID=98403 RepID=A0A151GT90_DRECN|nr:hypothetical protein DCS_01427 [Drechmeria coniospora]KYK60290.1 hypothetical protein DCS_01427 [Drechmeria coniospora]
MTSLKNVFKAFPPSMDVVESTTQYDGAIKQYLASLTQLSREERLDLTQSSIKVLDEIDAADNSLGYLTILDILLEDASSTPGITRDELLDRILEFLLKFDPIQVRYMMAQFLSLLARVSNGNYFSPLVAVDLIATAMLRLDPAGSTFTPLHLPLARLAYMTNSIEPALGILDADIFFYPNMPGSIDTRPLCDPDVPPYHFMPSGAMRVECLESTHLIEYDLCRGMAYVSRRDWDKALDVFEHAITHPAKDKGVSKIMTEAHKKWVLVGLLSLGRLPPLPERTPHMSQSTFEAANGLYNSFATLFQGNKTGELKKMSEENDQRWNEDGNASLVAEVMAAYQKWQIVNLRDVYERVSIAEVRRSTVSAETGEPSVDDETIVVLVRDMIKSGMLKGDIEEGQGAADSYLSFATGRRLLSEAEFTKEVARRHESILSLSQLYRATDVRLSGHQDFVCYLAKEEQRAEMDRESDPAVGFESQIEDEDLMTGIMATI